MLILIIAGGPDKGRIYELQEGKDVVLGRDGDPVGLNDRKCSRKHARLWADGGKWYLEDLGSTHGTFRNHKKIDHRVELKDGDYLQVGSTVMVMARMNALMAERAALLGDAPGRDAVLTPKMQKMLIGGGAIAAAVLLGLNTATYFKTSAGTQNLSQQLAAVAQDPQRAAFEDQVRTMLADGRITAEQMSETLAALGPDQERFKLELGRQLDTVLAAVEDDAQAEVLVAKLDGVLNAMRQQGGQTAAMADRVLAALDSQPTAEQLAEATASRVARAVQPLDPQVAADLTAAAERLASAETVGSQVAELRDLVEKMPGQLATPMGQVLARLETLSDTGNRSAAQLAKHREQLAAALETLRGQLPSDPTGRLDAALARLEDAPTRDQLAALTDRLAALPTLGDLEALERRDAERMTTLSAMLGSTDDDFAASLTRLRTQLADVATKLEQRPDAGDSSQIATQLAAISEKLDTQATPDADALGSIQSQLAEVRTELASLPRTRSADAESLRAELQSIGESLASRVDTRAMQGQLTAILTELKDRDDAGLIKEQLEALAANRPAASDPVLAQILASVQERAEAQTQTQRQLEALSTQIAQLEGATYTNTAMADLVDQIVARLPQSAEPVDTQALLASITGKLTEQQLASADSLRAMIRSEVLAAVDPLADQLQGQLNDRALADAASAVNEDGLSRTEQAYKLAFETGQTITVGAGPIDPQTGSATSARRLDPAAARAMGVENWREWYMLDDAAHRMRLAREASRVRGTLGDPSVVTLPDADMIYSASPRDGQ